MENLCQRIHFRVHVLLCYSFVAELSRAKHMTPNQRNRAAAITKMMPRMSKFFFVTFKKLQFFVTLFLVWPETRIMLKLWYIDASHSHKEKVSARAFYRWYIARVAISRNFFLQFEIYILFAIFSVWILIFVGVNSWDFSSLNPSSYIKIKKRNTIARTRCPFLDIAKSRSGPQ